MSEHTKEPWYITWDGQQRVMVRADLAPDFTRVVAICYGPNIPERDANARRIAACVNACRGITTEDLEELVKCGLVLNRGLLKGASDDEGRRVKG